jgi:hypothetical protein
MGDVMTDQHHAMMAGALKDDPLRWPLLTKATEGLLHKAYSTKVEWLIDKRTTCSCCGAPKTEHHAEYNYTQIFRVGFRSMSGAREASYLLFDNIESALRQGRREKNYTYSFMGGVLSLLGRWPRAEDEVILAVLRPLTLRVIENDMYNIPLDRPSYEFLIECSVIAREGK